MAVIKVNFISHSLMRAVDAHVVLPIEKANPGTRFKTLYLLHGFMGDYNDWLHYSDIVRLSRKHNLAVIMPSGDNHFYVNHSTSHENYSDFIGRELVEMMEKMFPLSGHRDDRFIGGLSMGGYGAIVNGLLYHQTFSHIIGISSALILKSVYQLKAPTFEHSTPRKFYESILGDIDKIPDSDKDYDFLAKKITTDKPKILMCCGHDDELVENNRRFSKRLEELDYDVSYIESAGMHNWAYWSNILPVVFDWLPVELDEENFILGNQAHSLK